MEELKLIPFEDVLDKHFGKKGTSRRDGFEQSVEEAVHAYRIGEAIKRARESKNITQEQLGEMIGVKKAQISRIEKGSNLTLATIRKVFNAMGMTTNLEVVGLGKFSIG